MTTFRKHATMWNRGVVLGVLAMCAGSVHAQTQQPPYSLFQYATLTGSGNTINATSIPVVISTGVTVYVNLTMQFNADSNGNLTMVTGYPQQIAAPVVVTAGFKAGNYVGPATVNSGNNLITVAGPGVTAGGATEWSLSASSGATTCSYPSTATWYVGPLSTNPLASRLQSAGLTSTAWSYGVGAETACGNAFWGTNSLLGFSQVGNTITIVSFTRNASDSAVPVDQITYTLKP